MSAPRWRMEWVADRYGYAERNLRRLYRIYMRVLFSKAGQRWPESVDARFLKAAERAGFRQRRGA